MNNTTKIPTPRTPADRELDAILLLSDQKNRESRSMLVARAYHQLHEIAIHCFRTEAPGRTLQPTAVLNEVCLRFLESDQSFESRGHFFGVAAEQMRRVLVESARKRNAKKRGGDLHRVDWHEAERIGFERPSELLDFNAALTRLKRVNPKWCRIANLRVFGGLSTAEAAKVVGIGESTARKHWAEARKCLRSDLRAYRHGA